MASTYTSNLGVEKIGAGEQAGTWGTTTNNNFRYYRQSHKWCSSYNHYLVQHIL